jgi:anti-sigma regulatory factor (Ser/Thr protein kinase)
MCDVTGAAVLDVPIDQSAPALARRFLRDSLCKVHAPLRLEDAELLVSELVTNGLKFGAPPIMLRVECEGDNGLRVHVRDASLAVPTPRSPEITEEGGRGLLLVDYISNDWGVSPLSDGKEVWFRLRD